jgi:hypothetical protein
VGQSDVIEMFQSGLKNLQQFAIYLSEIQIILKLSSQQLERLIVNTTDGKDL